MNLNELVAEVAIAQGLSKAKTRRVFGALVTTINTTMAAGDSFRVPGLGVFKSAYRNERTCRNPQNGDVINVPARNVPKLSFAKNVKRGLANATVEPVAANT
ncbi:HU family DNA-binding protein [Candidatus Woesebacteria bacterium]|nr:HU family DNA-binding protein [Candidatus Woesebacteria bacterium]